jgi:hypothetical protein
MNVRSAHSHPASGGVSEIMKAKVFDAEGLASLAEDPRYNVTVHRPKNKRL